MKAVVAAGLVVKHKRCGLCLPGFVANFQEGRMVRRKLRNVFAEGVSPIICNLGEVGISAASEICDQFRQRIAEVLVFADAEAIPLHGDMAAEAAVIVEERGELSAFSRRKNWSCNRIATIRKRLFSNAPVQGLHSLCDGERSGCSSCCVSHAASEKLRCSIEEAKFNA